MKTLPADQISDFGIVVPVGPGKRKWLPQTLRSLDAQKANVSVAICAVQDSKDLRDLLEPFSHIISYVRCSPDTGQSAAINEGWDAIKARYYSWLNDDDMLHPDALATVLSAFDNTNADIVYGRTDILQDGILRIGYGSTPIGDSLRRENTLAQPSTFVKRSALIDLSNRSKLHPVDPNKHFAMDWDLWQRLYLSKAKFHSIPNALSITRWYSSTKTANLTWSKFREYHQVLKNGNAGPKGLWSLVNIVIHHFATYGPMSSLFRFIQRLLSRRQRPQLPSQPVNKTLDVFHYQDWPIAVRSLRSSQLLVKILPSGEIFETEELGVSLEPSPSV